MKTSVFDLFKIGIGPSSSHTVGPMRAAREFAARLERDGLLEKTDRALAELYGSLALTGHGHSTDKAILLGLSGEEPAEVEPGDVDEIVGAVRSRGELRLFGRRTIGFVEARDLIFHKDQTMAAHPNGMRFTAFDAAAQALRSEIYYSVGGGFIEREGAPKRDGERAAVPFPFTSAAELLSVAEENGLPIWGVVLENEKAWRPEGEVRAHILRVWEAMRECTRRGLATEGILPGGLHVRRRAPRMAEKRRTEGATDALAPMDWLNVYAMAVNEENAAGGRVVTAPTNGAAGVIPAVAHYYEKFLGEMNEAALMRYFLTAGAIGILYKENASISGAEVGCQGEVGVACSMAAGALVAAMEGTNGEVEHAAEIGMEHNLGMTCDPIGGLVQIPCIERNAFGAMKAVNAARMAMRESGGHKVSLDQVIKTMYQTGLDMQSRYKETSLGGLAVNVVEC